MLDNIVKQKNKFHSLYLYCIDIDWFRIVCPKGHLMSSRYRSGPMEADHPIRSLHCPECNRYISMDKCELLPTRLPYNDPSKGYGYVQLNGIATSSEPSPLADPHREAENVELLTRESISTMMDDFLRRPMTPIQFPTIRRRHGTFIAPVNH